MNRAPILSLARFVAVAQVVAVMLAGCSPGGSGGGGSGSKQNVTLFASKARITAASGAAAVEPAALFETNSGPILLTDQTSSSVLGVLTDGTIFVFSSKADLTAATGQASVALGAFDQVRAGVLQDRLLAADSVSGNVLTILGNGSAAVFSSLANVTAVTGKGSAKMSLPRELTTNQIVAQDLVSLDMVRYDTQGNVTAFVSGAQIAAAAGLPLAQAIVVQWLRGATTQNLYGRFSPTNNVIRLQINGAISLHVGGAALKTLFKDVVDLQVLDIVGDTDSDALLLLIGDGLQGVAVAIVSSDGATVSVFATRKQLQNAAGIGVNLSDLSVLLNGIPVAVDRGGAQVLTFGQGGKPVIVGRGQDIRDAAGTTTPLLSISAGLTTGAALVFEEESDSLIQVR